MWNAFLEKVFHFGEVLKQGVSLKKSKIVLIDFYHERYIILEVT